MNDDEDYSDEEDAEVEEEWSKNKTDSELSGGNDSYNSAHGSNDRIRYDDSEDSSSARSSISYLGNESALRMIKIG